MKSYDFNAVIYDGSVYCTSCLPLSVNINDEGVHPIFADSEWGYIPMCSSCGASHDYMTILKET